MIPIKSKTGNGITDKRKTIRYLCFFFFCFKYFCALTGKRLRPDFPAQYPVNSPKDAPNAPLIITPMGVISIEYSITSAILEDGSSIDAFEKKQAINTPNILNWTCFFTTPLAIHAKQPNIKIIMQGTALVVILQFFFNCFFFRLIPQCSLQFLL